MKKKILTIGIPTYNRASNLDQSLSVLFDQLRPYSDLVDVLVSDNASNDTTSLVVEKYRGAGYDFQYVRHTENLGMDGNFISIYRRATTKYVWILSDDDILVPNGLKRIMNILTEHEDIGVLYLSNLWFPGEIDYEKFDTKSNSKIQEYADPVNYVKRVNYWLTFLSAHVVNKSLIDGKFNPEEFRGTFLALLAWNIPVCFAHKPCCVLETPVLACRAKGQGGYQFVGVFAVNFNKILSYFLRNGYPRSLKRIINLALLQNYFPPFILAKRSRQLLDQSQYESENWFWALLKVYYTNVFFYLYIVPAFVFPQTLYFRYRSLLRKYFNA